MRAAAARPRDLAPIFASTIREADAPYRVVGGPIVRIEPEIAFVLDRDLPAREQPYDEQDVRTAIREVRIVLEVLGCRYAGHARVEVRAAGRRAIQPGLCVGPVVPDGLNVPLETLALSFEGALNRAIDGRHPDGDPLKPLVWLVNFLASRGDAVRAGQIVTTGSYAGAIDVPLGDALTVRFGELGSLSVTLTA